MAFSFINFVGPFVHSRVIEGLNELSAVIHIVALFFLKLRIISFSFSLKHDKSMK